MLSYQGKLTDTFGLPVVDTTYSVNFRLYSAPSGGSPFWNETQTVRTREGLFSALLGSVTPIGSMPDAGAVYLGMAVEGGPELAPRLRIARAANADLLQGKDTTALDARYVNEAQANSVSSAMIANGTIAAADLGQMGASSGQVMKWTGSAWAPRNDSVGGGGGTVTSVSQGTGVTCDPNPITTTGTVALNTGYADGRYINVGETASGDITGTYPGPTVDGLQGRHISTASPGVGQVLKYNGAEWVPANDSAGAGDNAWVRGSPDSVLYTINRLGIARGGSNNALYGTQRFTHVNLGIACTTGTSGQNYSCATVGGGNNNDATGYYATVGGGNSNAADTTYATVGGGYNNNATGYGAKVGGGYNNDATGNAATVGGGNSNAAATTYATVGGGWDNDATGYVATVGGGYNNTASGDRATVGGGYSNAATGSYATVAGGNSNDATGIYATVAGGNNNAATGSYATVAGGNANAATGSHATVAGGYNNSADTAYATVAGGYNNTASGDRTTIGGGYSNDATGTYATVAGGYNSTASGQYATVGGGYCDTARAYASGALSGRNNVAGDAVADSCAVVCGGRSNSVTGKCGAVGGGEGNSVAGWHGTVAGGYQNSAGGFRSTVGGGEWNSASGWRSTVGGGSNDTAMSDLSGVLSGDRNVAGYLSGDSCAVVAGGSQNLAGAKFATVGGGELNQAVSRASAISGGYGNAATYPWSTVGGGSNNAASAQHTTVGGGQSNVASGWASTVPGGSSDTCAGYCGLAAGFKVRIGVGTNYTLAFGEDFSTSSSRSVVFYHSGAATKLGVGVKTPTHNIDVQGGAYCTGTNWVNGSSRALKTDISMLTPEQMEAVLRDLERTEVVNYRYKSEASGEEHIGLIAEDAPELLATPERDGINTADAIGWLVAIAKAQQAEIEALKAGQQRR